MLRLSEDLPIVIERVDRRENVERILPILDELIDADRARPLLTNVAP